MSHSFATYIIHHLHSFSAVDPSHIRKAKENKLHLKKVNVNRDINIRKGISQSVDDTDLYWK